MSLLLTPFMTKIMVTILVINRILIKIMRSENISEIKANFSYYVNLAVKKGETILICNHNVPVAEIKAVAPVKKSRVKFGMCKDKIILPDDFNETSQEIIDSFYTNNIFPKTSKKPRAKKTKK